MAGQKFLKINDTTGRATELEAIQTSAGAGDAGKIAALDSAGRFASNMMPVGIAPETASAVASEDIDAGNFVNLWLTGGVLKMRKADNSNAREADGFVLAAVATAATGTVYTEGSNTAVSGLTIASRYFLGTGGGVTTTPPTAAGSIVQELGKAKAATELVFDKMDAYERV